MKKIVTILISTFILFFNTCYAESIQSEIAKIENEAFKYNEKLSVAYTQLDLNLISYDLAILWDNELNSLWKRLFKELNNNQKEKILIQQREWIKRKEKDIEITGKIYEGGTIQPLIYNKRAAEITRVRVYMLAKYLAHIKKESFIISDEIKESLDYADPSLNDIFKSFEGCWKDFDQKNKYIGIERSDMCLYGVKNSNWTLWTTDGIILSDLDVYEYAKDNIIFKISYNGKNYFYKLSFSMEYSPMLEFGESLDKMDSNDTIFMTKY